MEYEFTTIKDIFETVPADKIDQCLKELAIAMTQAKSMNEILCEAAEAITGQKPDGAIEWPKTSTWIDNDKGEIDLNFALPGDDNIQMKTKVSV
jgi:hypothetical protein